MSAHVLVFWVDGAGNPVAYAGGRAELEGQVTRAARVSLLAHLRKRRLQDRQPVPPYTERRVIHEPGAEPDVDAAEPTGEVYQP